MKAALFLVILFKSKIKSDTSLNRPVGDTVQGTIKGMVCVTPEHTWAQQLHRPANGRDAEPRAVIFQSVDLMEKDAKRTSRASRTPRAPNHCQMWGGRTENIPESPRKTPARRTPTSPTERLQQSGAKRSPESAERLRAESGLWGMMMPPLSSAPFFN